jgi:hypothetical protein
MSEQIEIIIKPNELSSDMLTIDDAMRQILDYFTLLKASSKTEDSNIEWRLVSASTNSPLTIRAEPFSKDMSVVADYFAAQQVEDTNKAFDCVVNNKPLPFWVQQSEINVIQSFLKRNVNGIAETKIASSSANDNISITNQDAREGLYNLEKIELETKHQIIDKSYIEYGSIEGIIASVETCYNKPCLRVRSRFYKKEILCQIGEEAISVGEEHSISDAWKETFIIVTGKLLYNRNGELDKVIASNFEKITHKNIDIQQVAMNNLNGLSPVEYLNELEQ